MERLRRDLLLRGVGARILDNLQVGDDFRQLDFVIITDHRAVVCEYCARFVSARQPELSESCQPACSSTARRLAGPI